MTPQQYKMFFHKTWLNNIKRETGASLVIHEQEGDTYFLKVNMKNKDGEKKTIRYKIEGTPQDVKNEDYENVLRELLTYAKV